ncbi:MAG: RNA polymerase sigma factor [Opitutaceae bacterium]|nr:RNA polymerase sigma factor [Opitutaceae bacterium]
MNLSPPEQDRWFAEEVQPHETALRVYLRQRFPEVRDADDVVQESFVRMLGARHRGPIANTKAYLFAVAGNLARNLLQRSRVVPLGSLEGSEVASVADETSNTANQVSARQEAAVLLDAIDALPRRCREVFILVKLQGCSHQAAADRLGLSIQTVHAQIVRGLRKCTVYLRKHGVGKEGRP